VQKRGRRDLYYKSGYLIDFPRTINDLAKYEDSRYQAEIFGIMLSEQEHFARNDMDKEASAQVCSWDEFEAWLHEEEKEETTPGVNGSQHDVGTKTDSVHTSNGVPPKPPLMETPGNGSPGINNKTSKWYHRAEQAPKENRAEGNRSFPLSLSLGKKRSNFFQAVS
jgi:hypothetical protein